MRQSTLLVCAVIGILLAACVSSPAQVMLPTPEAPCQATFAWQGIVPGKSTQQDVIDALGPPLEKGAERFDQHTTPFYAYRISGGTATQFVQDRIFFRSDGVVDWLEVVVADRDGEFHSIRSMLDKLGNNLDAIYWNNNYRHYSGQFDVLAGPDQVWVWSECGVALNTTGDCNSSNKAEPLCSEAGNSMEPMTHTSTTLTLRYPNRLPEAFQVKDPSVDNDVLMMFLFPSTSYKGFTEYYMQKIPFELWTDFLDKLRHDNSIGH